MERYISSLGKEKILETNFIPDRFFLELILIDHSLGHIPLMSCPSTCILSIKPVLICYASRFIVSGAIMDRIHYFKSKKKSSLKTNIITIKLGTVDIEL